MYFLKPILTRRILSLFVFLTMLIQVLHPPVMAAFSFFGFGDPEPEVVSETGPEIPAISQTPLMAVLVESTLYEDSDITQAIDRYAVDGAQAIEGRSVLIPIDSDTSPKEIYEGLAHLYYMGDRGDGKSKLRGVVLIGDLPLPVVEKNDRLWPTIFPYTDFEQRNYRWDEEADRFVFETGRHMHAEIWHGVIRSPKAKFEHQKAEILSFLEQNHAVHSGAVTFRDQVFYQDAPAQSQLPSFLKTRYEQWIKHAEDLVYQRWSPELLAMMEASLNGQEADEVDPLPINDIQAKDLIIGLAKNYQSIGKNWLGLLAQNVERSGAWDAEDLRTTIGFIATKDQAALNQLKATNDLLEVVFQNWVVEHNVAEDIAVSKSFRVDNPDDPYGLVENKTEEPLYWNGLLRADMEAKDCSLYRGKRPNVAHPLAQKVRASASSDPETAVFDMTVAIASDGPDGASGCKDILAPGNQGPNLTKRMSSLVLHLEPTPETLKAQAEASTAEALPIDDPRGFSFYDHQQAFHRLDFVNVFDYLGQIDSPETLETELTQIIKQKVAETNAITEAGNAASADRYARDKSQKWVGERFSLPSGSDLTGDCRYVRDVTNVDAFHKKIFWTETCNYESETSGETIETQNKVFRFYETGALIPDDKVEQVLNQIDFQALYQAYEWLDLNLEAKERLAFDSLLTADETTPGYQLLHLHTHPSDGSTLPIGIDSVDNDYDEAFIEVGFEQFRSELEPLSEVPEPSEKEQEPLSGPQKLTVWPEQIFVFKDNPYLTKVVFTLEDGQGNIDVQAQKTEVELSFSDADADNFFEVLPSKKVSVYDGKATFFLSSKEVDYGGKFSLMGTVVGREDLQTEPIPVIVSRYRTLASAQRQSIEANDVEGVVLSVEILDDSGQPANAFAGKTLRFVSEWGTFPGGEPTAEIIGNRAQILFYPGRKSGNAIIDVMDEIGEVPSGKIRLTILPGKPHHLALKKQTHFLVKSRAYQPITVELLDLYGNPAMTLGHEISWKVEGGEVERRAEIDTNPRQNGVQEWANDSASTIRIRPNRKAQEVRVSVNASLLDKDKGVSRTFVIKPAPEIEAEISKEKVLAGSGERIGVQLQSKDKEGNQLPHDFLISLSSAPARFAQMPKTVEMGEGKGYFEFLPGTRAGKYTITLTADGFETQTIDFEIEAGRPEKITLKTDNDTWDKDEESIPIDIVLADQYGNRATAFNDKISLRSTEQSKDLVRVPVSELQAQRGRVTVGVLPLGKGGKANLIAEGNGLKPARLSIKLTDQLTAEEVRETVAPKAKFMILSGAVGGNLNREENVASSLLFSGNLQAIATLGVPYQSAKKQYGALGEAGEKTENLSAEFVFEQERPEVFLTSGDRVLAKARFFYDGSPEIFNHKKGDEYGIYISPAEGAESSLEVNQQEVLLEGVPLISFAESGGINLLSGGISLVMEEANIKQWLLLSDKRPVARIRYQLPEILSESGADDFEGVLLKPLDPEVHLSAMFTGNSTTSLRGFSIEDKNVLAPGNQKLGSTHLSIESTQASPQNLWRSAWKPAVLFGAGNTIGKSVQTGGSDALLLLGDPTLSRGVSTHEETDQTVGKLLWRSGLGAIDDVFWADVNGDENIDLLPRVGNKLMGLYQTEAGVGDFVDMGPILSFSDGVQSLTTLSLRNAKIGFTDFIQINRDGEFIWHKNDQGVFTSQKVPFAQKFTKIKSANLNNDAYADLVGLDRNQKLWTILGADEGFGAPEILEELSSTFETVEEGAEGIRPATAQISVSYEDLDDDLRFSENDSRRTFAGGATSATFVPLTQTTLKTNFEVKGQGPLAIGSRVRARLELTSPDDLQGIRLIIPDYKNLEFEVSSLNCRGCDRLPKVKPKGTSRGIELSEFGLGARSKVTLTWDLRVASLPERNFFIGRFGNQDGETDRVMIPGGEDEPDRIIEYEPDQYGWHTLLRMLASFGGGVALAQGLDSLEGVEEGGDAPGIIMRYDSSVSPYAEWEKEEDDEVHPGNGTNQVVSSHGKRYSFYCSGGTSASSEVPKKIDPEEQWYKMANCTVKEIESEDEFGGGLGGTTPVSTASTPAAIDMGTGGASLYTAASSATSSSSQLSLESSNGAANTDIYPVDEVSHWMRDQIRYIGYNVGRSLHNVLFFAPDHGLFESADLGRPISDKRGVYEDLKQTLAAYPYVNIHTTVVTEEIPTMVLFEGKELSAEEQEIVHSYAELKTKILEQRGKNFGVLKEVAEEAKKMSEYYVQWRADNDVQIQAWANRTSEWESLYQQVKEASADFFADFDEEYRTEASDRGTWLPWLYRRMYGETDTSLITFETYPDVMFDMSEVSMGIDVYLTEVIINPIEIETSALKTYKEELWEESKVQVTLPELPILPDPPPIPEELLDAINERMENPKAAKSLFGELRLGTAKVPEWGVRPYIEQLSMPDAVDPSIDWGQLDLPPLQEKIPQNETKSTLDHEEISFHMDSLHAQEDRLDELLQRLAFEEKNIERSAAESLSVFFAQNTSNPHRTFTANNLRKSYAEPPEITVSIPETVEAQPIELPQPGMVGLYFEDTEKVTQVVRQNLAPNAKPLLRDIDGDGLEEILYTDGPNLYLKYRRPKPETDEAYRFEGSRLEKWSSEKFLSRREVASNTKVSVSSVFFMPFGEILPYYEWFLSDRPDAKFEMTKFPDERKSKVWKRRGFIRSDIFQNYKISDVPLRVTEVRGSPQISRVKPQPLLTYNRKKCLDPAVKKPTFNQKTVFLAQRNNTQMEIRVPAKQFRAPEYQTFRLQKGEVISIESGEVCVFAGQMEYVIIDDEPTLISAQKGDLIASGMAVNMGEGDFLQMALPDETFINIFERDQYRLDFFDPDRLPIRLELHNDQHLYAFLVGFQSGLRTLVRSHFFIPQKP